MPPFTARVVAAWLVAFGLATALAAVAGDLRRLRTAAIAYTVFGVLVLVAVARFPDTLDWDDPADLDLPGHGRRRRADRRRRLARWRPARPARAAWLRSGGRRSSSSPRTTRRAAP